MRTPGLLVFGMVFSPCGLLLNVISTAAPNWRQISSIPGQSSDMVLEQGIWDICQTFISSQQVNCGQTDTTYFSNQIIPVAKGLMVASVLVTALGLAVATAGVRCWKDYPNWIIAGIGGIFIFLSGVMVLIPIAWYTYIMTSIPAASQSISVGYCIILGYIGAIMEILAGAAFVIGMCSCCGGWNRGERHKSENTFTPRTRVPRRIEVPSINRSRSDASSVPYARDSLDGRNYPRAKYHANRPANTSYNTKPYDVDL